MFVSSEIQKVVVRFIDGRVLKGVTQDFSPMRPLFHLHVSGGEMTPIQTKQLKAVFMVRDLEGDRARQDTKGFVTLPAETAAGKKIAVRFKDGELICGYTNAWTPERPGFFVTPADQTTNNVRVYVVSAAAAEVKAGPAAEELASKWLQQHPEAKRDPRAA